MSNKKKTHKKLTFVDRVEQLPNKIIYTVLAVFCFVLYANTLGHGFALDDAIVLTQNTLVQKGIAGWPEILSKDTFFGFFNEEGKAALVAGGRYRPLTLLMFALLHQIFGASPFVFHLLSIIMYALSCCLLFHFLNLLLSSRQIKFSKWVAFLAALFFVAHPVHTEAVANIKGMDESVSLVFGLLCLIQVIKYKKTSQTIGLAFMSLCLFLSLLTKETALTFIAIIPLTFMLAYPKSKSKGIIPFAVCGGAVLIYLAIRTSIVGMPSSGDLPTELMNNPFLKWTGSSYISLDFSEKFGVILFCLLHYLRLLFFPYTLTHDYYPKHIEIHTLGDPIVWLSALFYLALLGAAIYMYRKKPIYSYGILFFLFTLFITSNIALPIGTFMSERFLFFPSVGFCLVLAYFLTKVGYKWMIPLSAILLTLGSARTITRNPIWKNNLTLFTQDVLNAPNSAKLRNAAAGVLLDTYGTSKDSKKKTEAIDEAIGHAEKAIELHPTYSNPVLLLANAHLYNNNFDEAIKNYKSLISSQAQLKDAKNNLRIAYSNAGQYYGEQKGDINRAMSYLKEGLKLSPKDYNLLRLMGVAHGQKGEGQLAADYFYRAAQVNSNEHIWQMLGIASKQANNQSLLTKAKQEIIKINPNAKINF